MGHTALVTGGNRGIGLAIARDLAARGHQVAITHRGTNVPDGFFGVRCDMRDEPAVQAAFACVREELGPVDILVANAGMTIDKLAIRLSAGDFRTVVETNLFGTWLAARAAAKMMMRSHWGRMVLISSVAGLSGNAGQTAYAASKAGLVGLARSLALELGPVGVTVNVVAPGLIDTEMTDKLPPAVREATINAIPCRRSGSAAEVADAVGWLVGDSAGYVNGAVIPVDGGLGMGH